MNHRIPIKKRKLLNEVRREQCSGQKTRSVLQSSAGTQFTRPWKGSSRKGKGE